MKKDRILRLIAQGFILFSAFALLSVALLAFFNPQSVMDLVQVSLTNTDAISSIRGVYGGVGLTVVISLVYLMRKDPRTGLLFLTFFWGFYALSRLITQLHEGNLGSFGRQWMIIEGFCFLTALTLFVATATSNKRVLSHSL